MDRKFFSFVWRHSRRDQMIILALTVLSFPLVLFSLELPKEIINEAIEGRDFPKVYFGFEIEQVPYLLILSALFLVMVVLINTIKWLMNVRVGMAGERMLRRMRFMLFERVMLFRMSRFRSTKPGEVIQSILGEIEPLGGFFGEVIATPAFQGGLLVVYTTFIFLQDVVLGLAAVALLPVQGYIIPKLQAKIVRLNKDRARNTRKLADTIGESVNVIAEVHTHGTARWHMAQVAGRLFENTVIRLQLFERKFTIKFINNFINQLTPFFFYSVGGFLVIRGNLDIGSLIAVLVAYKEVAAPWKAVLNYWQRWTDFNSRYVFVVENFSGDDVFGPERIYSTDTDNTALSGPLGFHSVEGGPGTGGLTIASSEIQPGQMVGVLGGTGGGRESFLRMAAGLAVPASGRVTIGGRNLADCTLAQIGSSIAYVGAEPGIVSRSMRENLLYGLMRGAPDLAAESAPELRLMLREAELTGNSTLNPEGDWILYDAAGVADTAELGQRLMEYTDLTGLSGELYSSALDSHLDAERAAEWTDRILAARSALRAAGPDLSDLVEDWDRSRYNTNATILENVLFALPDRAQSDMAELAGDPKIKRVLDEAGALPVFLEIGWEIAREFSDLLDAVEEDSVVLDSFSGYARADIVAAHELVLAEGGRVSDTPPDTAKDLLFRLAAGFVVVRDQLDVLDDDRTARLLGCRALARELLTDVPGFVAFDEDHFSPAQTVAENILHAKRRYDRRSAWKRLEDMMETAIDTAGLREDLIRLGLNGPVSASALSASSRRRIALVRGLIKRPGLLVLDGIAGSESKSDRALRRNIRTALPEATILYAASEEGAVDGADLVTRITENGAVSMQEAAVPQS